MIYKIVLQMFPIFSNAGFANLDQELLAKHFLLYVNE